MVEITDHAIEGITKFEGEPRLEARLCEGDRYEVGYGCTYYPDGRRVQKGDVITPDMVIPMLRHCMKVELAPVLGALDRKPSQNWIDAFALFAFNVGGHNVVNEPAAALTLFNEGREADAAAAFVSWISATSAGPSALEAKDSYYAGAWSWHERQNAQGETYRVRLWTSPDGKPCLYRKRMRGLLRRALATGCIARGYDWEHACRDEAVFLQRERRWDASNGRWTDRIHSMTQLKDVLPIASQYPLSAAPITLDPKYFPAPADEELFDPAPESQVVEQRWPEPVPRTAPEETAPAPPVVAVVEETLPEPVPAKKPPQPYRDYDPAREAKGMPVSKRFHGLWLIFVGWIGLVGEALQGAGSALAQMPFIRELAALNPIQLKDWRMGLLIIAAGYLLYWYGQVKAKGPVK